MFVSVSNGTDGWLGRLALPFLPRLAPACWLSSCHSLCSPFSCLKTPGLPSKGLPYVTITIAWAEHCDSITCSLYAGLPAPWGQEKPWLLLPSIQHSAPAHQRCSKHMSRMNKLLVWITEWGQILPGEDTASSKKYSEKQTNSFSFAVWKVPGWPFSDLSIRVKSQRSPSSKT